MASSALVGMSAAGPVAAMLPVTPLLALSAMTTEPGPSGLLDRVQGSRSGPDAGAAGIEPELGIQNRRLIQGALKHLGFYTAPIDGTFGPATRRSIQAYQRRIGQRGTGFLTTDQIIQLFLTAKREGEILVARELAEADRLAREQAEQNRLAHEQAEQNRLAREQAEERDRLAREQAERERLVREQAERDRLAREQAERERLARAGLARAQAGEPEGEVPLSLANTSLADSSASDLTSPDTAIAGPSPTAVPPADSVGTDAPDPALVPRDPVPPARPQPGQPQSAPLSFSMPGGAEGLPAPDGPGPEIAISDQAVNPVERRAILAQPVQMALQPAAPGAVETDGWLPTADRPARPAVQAAGRAGTSPVQALAADRRPHAELSRRQNAMPGPVGRTSATAAQTRTTSMADAARPLRNATAATGPAALQPGPGILVPVEETESANRSLATTRAGGDAPDGLGGDGGRSATVIVSTSLGELSFSPSPDDVPSDAGTTIDIAAADSQAVSDSPLQGDDEGAGYSPATVVPTRRVTIAPASSPPASSSPASLAPADAPVTGDDPGAALADRETGVAGPAPDLAVTAPPQPDSPLVEADNPDVLTAELPGPVSDVPDPGRDAAEPAIIASRLAATGLDRAPGIAPAPSGLSGLSPAGLSGTRVPPTDVRTGPGDAPGGFSGIMPPASAPPLSTLPSTALLPIRPADDALVPPIVRSLPDVSGRQDSDVPSAVSRAGRRGGDLAGMAAAGMPATGMLDAAPTRNNWLERVEGTFTGYIKTPDSQGEFPVRTRFDYDDGQLTGAFQSFINGLRRRGRLTEVKVIDDRTIEMTWRSLWEAGPVRFHFSEDLSSFNGVWGRERIESVPWVGTRR